MTSRTAIYGVGGVVLVACLAAANMPSQDADASRPRAMRTPHHPSPDALALEVRSQATRLHALMAQAPVPDANPRNPFSFAPRIARVTRPATVQAAVADDPPPVALPAAPQIALVGMVEDATPAGPRRTAVIASGDDVLFAREGEELLGRYKVTKIGADAVELEDLVSKAFRRLALR